MRFTQTIIRNKREHIIIPYENNACEDARANKIVEAEADAYTDKNTDHTQSEKTQTQILPKQSPATPPVADDLPMQLARGS